MNTPANPQNSQQQQQPTQRRPSVEEMVNAFATDVNAAIPQFARVLPPGITGEAFARVAITAVQKRPELLNCSKHHLFVALMQAAEDGLLPDGREGVLNVYNTKTAVPDGNGGTKDVFVKAVQWLPMVEGVRKLLWNAGIILETGVVYRRDKFEYQRGDDPRIMHVPMPGPRGVADMVAVYSVARFPDGRVSRDWMWREEVEQIRQAHSRSANSPAWRQETTYQEMAVKTVVHHHSKSLPTSSAVRDMVSRPEFWDSHAEQGDGAGQTAGIAPIGAGTGAALPSPNNFQQPIQQERTVSSTLEAIGNGATGEAVEPQRQRRTRRTKEQMEAARAAEEATKAQGGNGATNGAGASQAQQEAKHQPVDAGAGYSGGPVFEPDDEETGEIYDNEDPPGEVALVPAQGGGIQGTSQQVQDAQQRAAAQAAQQAAVQASQQQAGGTQQLNRAEVEKQLKMLLGAWSDWTTQNLVTKEGYLTWIETALRNVQTAEQRQAAVQWWQMTGGMRQQLGITADETNAFKERVQNFLQPA